MSWFRGCGAEACRAAESVVAILEQAVDQESGLKFQLVDAVWNRTVSCKAARAPSKSASLAATVATARRWGSAAENFRPCTAR